MSGGLMAAVVARIPESHLWNRCSAKYRMADSRIGVAGLAMPDVLPPESVANARETKVHAVV